MQWSRRGGQAPWSCLNERLLRWALKKRRDLQVITGKVFDAQRAVVVAADALGADLLSWDLQPLENGGPSPQLILKTPGCELTKACFQRC